MEKRLWNLYRWSASYVGFKFKLPKKDQGPSSSSERYTLCYSQVLDMRLPAKPYQPLCKMY